MKKKLLTILIVIFVIGLLVFSWWAETQRNTGKGQKKQLHVRQLSADEVDALKVDANAQLQSSDPAKVEEEPSKPVFRYAEVEVTQTADKVYLCLEYTNVYLTPESAFLYNPEYTECLSPVSINKNNDGKIVFLLDHPVTGTWTVIVSSKQELGTYLLYALDEEKYNRLNLSNTDIPRDLGCEGAQIDE